MNPAEISRRWLVCQIGLANLTHETSELNLPRLDLAADEIAYIHKPSFGCPGEPADEDHAKCPERARLRCEQQFVRIGQTQHPGPTAATKEPRAAQEVYLDEIAEAASHGLTLLEKKAIRDRTAKYYGQEFKGLQDFAKERRVSMNAGQLDRLLNSYFNHLKVSWSQGGQDHGGCHASASRICRTPGVR